jgi:hypothetical protein
MAHNTSLRRLTATALFTAEAIVAMTMLAIAPAPVGAQFFDDRFPFQSRRQRGPFDWFEPAPQQQERAPAPAPPPDFSKAPAPKKADPKAEVAVTTPIMVFGDAMADWLGYGLELAYADSPEIGILRRHRTNSGLIRTEVRNDPRGEYPDWPQAAREMIAAQKSKFVLMMIGVNDRKQIREAAQVAPAPRVAKPAPQQVDGATLELDKPTPDKPAETPAIVAPEPAATGRSNFAPTPGAKPISGASTTPSRR